jgi:hypothetical protein
MATFGPCVSHGYRSGTWIVSLIVGVPGWEGPSSLSTYCAFYSYAFIFNRPRSSSLSTRCRPPTDAGRCLPRARGTTTARWLCWLRASASLGAEYHGGTLALLAVSAGHHDRAPPPLAAGVGFRRSRAPQHHASPPQSRGRQRKSPPLLPASGLPSPLTAPAHAPLCALSRRSSRHRRPR